MKKLILPGVAVIVVLGLFVMGPALLDLYRLQRYVSKSAEAYQADGGPWPHLTDVCTGCHGYNGHSQDQSYPSLAGQPAAYVATQLRSFADGQRANPTMGPLSMTFSDVEIRLLADYFAGKPVSGNRSFQPDSALREKGRQLVATRACAACHGAQLTGHDQFPGLAGQGYDYLLEQLDAFAFGTRSESTGTMKKLAAGASPDERKAIAAYLAGLVPESQASPKNQRE